MKTLFLALALLAASTVQAADWTKGFVTVSEGHRLYVEQRPAAPGKTTLFIANGLTYSTKQWEPLVKALDRLDPELGLVLYDMTGMGQTLLDHAPVNYDIPFTDQVQDLKNLVTKLDVQGPKILTGLSYGGAVTLSYMSQFPGDFRSMIVMSPFLSRMPSQDKWINDQVNLNHMLYPFDPRTNQELYDWYLRVLVTSTYPSVEPVILENPYKLEGVYRMVKGSETWDALKIVEQLPLGKLHLMSAQYDEYVPLDLQQAFWQKVPPVARASNIVIAGVHHKFPEEIADFAANWVLHIVNGDPNLSKGLTFAGDPQSKTAKSGSVVIPLKKESACEPLLQRNEKPR